MSIKTVYLHIGLHKTGTTAIQYFLSKNPGLSAKGFFYPSAGRPQQEKISYGHHRLPWSLMRDTWDIGCWEQVIREIEDAGIEKIVLSSEEFDVLDDMNISRVRSFLSDYPVKVIVYLRRQDEFAQAYYTTDVLYNREMRELQKYIESLRTSLDYWKLLSSWAGQFGQENVIVRVYDKNALVGRDTVRDFCHVAGIEFDDLFVMPPADINRGFPKNVVDLVRNMRKMSLQETWVYSVIEIAEKLYRRRKNKMYDLMSPSQSREFMERFHETNTRVAMEYLGREGLFEPTTDDESSEKAWNQLYGNRFGSIGKTIADLKAYVLACKQR